MTPNAACGWEFNAPGLFNGDRNKIMAIQATQIRRGMMILFEGEPCKVMEFRHHTPGNLRAMVQAKLRNIKTGSSFEHRFRSSDAIERDPHRSHHEGRNCFQRKQTGDTRKWRNSHSATLCE